MNIPMDNMDLAIMFGMNNETKMGYWMSMNLNKKKTLWPQLSDATRRYFFERLPQEERNVLEELIMSPVEVYEMKELINQNSKMG